MKQNNRDIRLYNAIFPVWLLHFLPQLWIFVLPANFLVDSLVLIVSMYVLKIVGKPGFYKRHIFKIFCFGMLSDILGAVFMWQLLAILIKLNATGIGFGDELFITIPGVMVAGVLIYLFNYFNTFKNCEEKLRRKMSLIFAIATAPYTMLLRNSWLG